MKFALTLLTFGAFLVNSSYGQEKTLKSAIPGPCHGYITGHIYCAVDDYSYKNCVVIVKTEADSSIEHSPETKHSDGWLVYVGYPNEDICILTVKKCSVDGVISDNEPINYNTSKFAVSYADVKVLKGQRQSTRNMFIEKHKTHPIDQKQK
ncbi:MAG: hypothetical protein V1647_02805 [Pseudomonadota bacterium]